MSGTAEQDKGYSVEQLDSPPPAPSRPRGGATSVPAEDEAGERSRDYLDGFLKGSETAAASTEDDGETLYDKVIGALRDIFDPEIPVNIYDLGLIYGVDVDDGHVDVTMTLTTPHCPVAESMPGEVETRVAGVPGVGSANVVLVWDPPWDPQKMSDEAKLELGML